MVKAQKYLDEKYPKEERKNITELDISNKHLEGKLKLENFVNLEMLECSENKLNELDISMCSKLKLLNCGGNKLEGNLDCSKNRQLILLICWINNLEKLNVAVCSQLRFLGCSSNSLRELNLENNSKLTQLDIANNNFSKQDLSFLRHLTNLDLLLIGNDSNKTGGVRNRFYGSLKPLQNMENLKFYNYDNTDVEKDINDEDILPAELGKLPKNSKKLAYTSSMRLDPQLGNWVSSVIHAKGSLSLGALQEIVKSPPQLLLFNKQEKEIYDSIKKEIRKKIKARKLLEEELTEKDEKIKELEMKLLTSEKEIEELEKLLVPSIDVLSQKLEIKRKELEELVNDAKEEVEQKDLDNLEKDLIYLVKSQDELVKGNNVSQKYLEDKKETIRRYFKNDQQIAEICQKQKEITELETGLYQLKKKNVKNILLIGRTGSGKSTLANVLTGTNEFKEGGYGISETKETQIGELAEKYALYRVIDTVGIGDTQLSEENVLDKIVQTIYYLKDGVNQIIFVTSDKFDEGEILAYELVKTIFSSGSEDIDDFITIVRTKFDNFNNKEECKKDIELMVNNGGKLSAIIKKVKEKGKIIHVNNGIEQERKISQSILIDYLVKNCRKTYKDSLDLQNLSEKISLNMRKIERIKKKISEETRAEEIEILKNEMIELKQQLRQATKEHIDWNKVAEAITESAKLANQIVSVAAKCRVM